MKGAELKELRAKHGKTQADVAKHIGISTRQYMKYENDEVEPKDVVLKAIINFIENEQSSSMINKSSGGQIALKYKTGSESIDIESAGKDWIVTKSGMRYYEREDGLYHLETMLVPFEAHQAYLADDVQEYGEWEKVTFIVDRIGRGRYLGWRTHGESMFNYQNPSFYDTPGNSLLLSRELGRHLWQDGFNHNKAPLGWVLVTKKNIVHKDIIKFDKASGIITCHSRNPDPEYQDFELSLNDVNEIHKVIKRSM